MGNYPPAYLYRKISGVSSFISSMVALRAPSGDTLPPLAACPHTPSGDAQSRPEGTASLVSVCSTNTPLSSGEDAQSHNPVEVQEVVEEVQEVVEEIIHVVQEVQEVVEEIQEVVEEVKEDIEKVQEEIKEDIERVQEVQQVHVEDVQDVMMEEAPEALQVVHESFMPPAFHFPTSPFSMSLSMSPAIETPPTNRLRYRKRRG